MPSLNTLNIYVVKPKEATNLVTNPSFEKTTTGYTAVSSTIARTNSEQRRGAYGLEVTPTTGVDAGVYFGTVSLVAGTEYTFSVDVKGVAGQAMRLQVRNTSGVSVGGQTFVATGYWQRVSMSYTETVTNSRRLYVIRDAVASTDKFYLDGFQMEAGAESTYFDGDMKGYVRNRVDFRWLGAAHASQSWRSATTRKGGELVNLKTLCNILGIIGLGMAPLSPQALTTTLPGSLYQRTSIDDREFSIPVLFDGDNFRDVMLARKSVIDLIRPDAGSDDQPITIVMEAVDVTSKAVTERVTIAAHYTGGLEMKITGGNQRIEKATLGFKAYLPFIVSDGSRSIDIGVSTTTPITSVIRQKLDGSWDNMSITVSGADAWVRAVAIGPDGAVYFGGTFDDFAGISTAGIIKYDGSSFVDINNGSITEVSDMKIGPDGNLYISGQATGGGVILKWDGSAWTVLGTSVGTGLIYSICFTDDDYLYIAGDISEINGVTVNGLARMTLAGVVSALGTGISSAVVNKIISVGTSVYIGGTFSAVSGVSASRAAKYNGSAWSALGTGASGGLPSTEVYDLAYDLKSQKLYITGNFNAFNGVTAEGIGYWYNGVFTPLATNVTVGGSTSFYNLKKIALDDFGGLYVIGADYLNGVYYGGWGARRFGGVWLPMTHSVSGGTWTGGAINGVFFGGGQLYLLYAVKAGTFTTNYSVLQNMSSARINPVFSVTGPGKLWEIRNYTTGQVVVITGLTLSSGEILTLDLTPGQISFTSNYRGNMMRYIVPGSNLDLFLQSGVNNVSAFMTDTTAASEILMTWQDTYWSLDGAVR